MNASAQPFINDGRFTNQPWVALYGGGASDDLNPNQDLGLSDNELAVKIVVQVPGAQVRAFFQGQVY